MLSESCCDTNKFQREATDEARIAHTARNDPFSEPACRDRDKKPVHVRDRQSPPPVVQSPGSPPRTPRPVSAAFDRGPAKHFHGRKKILGDFDGLLKHYSNNATGGTFLIQGAPGAGKTALLSECGRRAQEAGWRIARVPGLSALWRPSALHSSLYSGKSLLDGRVIDRSAGSVLEMLRGGVGPLLLKLDEAQRLEDPGCDLDTRISVGGVLTAIHNGHVGRPLVLLAGGLGTTRSAFGSLGIERFERSSFVELERLDKEAEQAVIRDWLTVDGGAKGDPTEWIDAIMQETHGWPQHILLYVHPALDRLRADSGNMTREGLNVVLKAGREHRAAFYEQRADGFTRTQRRCLASIFENLPTGGSTIRSAIMSALARKHGEATARKLFRLAQHRGILQMTADGRYAIPIPSMQAWLID